MWEQSEPGLDRHRHVGADGSRGAAGADAAVLEPHQPPTGVHTRHEHPPRPRALPQPTPGRLETPSDSKNLTTLLCPWRHEPEHWALLALRRLTGRSFAVPSPPARGAAPAAASSHRSQGRRAPRAGGSARPAQRFLHAGPGSASAQVRRPLVCPDAPSSSLSNALRRASGSWSARSVSTRRWALARAVAIIRVSVSTGGRSTLRARRCSLTSPISVAGASCSTARSISQSAKRPRSASSARRQSKLAQRRPPRPARHVPVAAGGRDRARRSAQARARLARRARHACWRRWIGCMGIGGFPITTLDNDRYVKLPANRLVFVSIGFETPPACSRGGAC